MMRKTITRTMQTSTIKGFRIDIKDGQPIATALDPLTVMGNAKEKDALKALKEKYGKDTTLTVGSIQVEDETYEISVEDFIKHATKVEKKTTEAETTN